GLGVAAGQRQAGGDLVVVDRGPAALRPRRAPGERDQLVHAPRQADLLGHERRAALEAEGRHGHAPAVVERADDVGHRDADLIVEDLAEVAVAGQRLDRPDLDPGRVHGTDHPGDAGVARCRRIGPNQELLELGDVSEARPDLLSGDDEVVAVDLGARLERRQIGAGVGLREALAPHHVAAQDARQMVRLLLVAAARDERRARVLQADEAGVDVRSAGPRILLVPDQLLHRGGAAPAELPRPRDAGPARVVHAPLPGHVPLAAGAQVGALRPAGARDVGREPVARLGAERLLFRAESDLHASAQLNTTPAHRASNPRA